MATTSNLSVQGTKAVLNKPPTNCATGNITCETAKWAGEMKEMLKKYTDIMPKETFYTYSAGGYPWTSNMEKNENSRYYARWRMKDTGSEGLIDLRKKLTNADGKEFLGGPQDIKDTGLVKKLQEEKQRLKNHEIKKAALKAYDGKPKSVAKAKAWKAYSSTDHAKSEKFKLKYEDAIKVVMDDMKKVRLEYINTEMRDFAKRRAKQYYKRLLNAKTANPTNNFSYTDVMPGYPEFKDQYKTTVDGTVIPVGVSKLSGGKTKKKRRRRKRKGGRKSRRKRRKSRRKRRKSRRKSRKRRRR